MESDPIQVGRYHSVEEASAAEEQERLREAMEIFRKGTPVVVGPGAEITPRRSIVQDWVTGLGLRHQGVLMTVIRGCDTAPKDDPSKLLTRCIRAVILNAHCNDPRKAATFIQVVEEKELYQRFDAFRRNLDHYPHHYIAHVMHAIEIIGYKHPDEHTRDTWHYFYLKMVRGLHLNPETEAELDERLNADEKTFSARDREPVVYINREATPGGSGGGGA